MASGFLHAVLAALASSAVMASSVSPQSMPTFNASVTNTTAGSVRGEQPFELYVMIRVVAVILLCCSGGLVTGLGYRERQRLAKEQAKRDQLVQLFVAKLDSFDAKLLGLAGYCVETGGASDASTSPQRIEARPSSDPVKFAVIRRCRKKSDRDALIRQARSLAGNYAGSELDIPIPPLPEFRLRIVQDSGQCDVCADSAAQDIVNLGGCIHTLCSGCASRVKSCPFCRAPLVDAATGALSHTETPRETQLLQAQLSRGSSTTVVTLGADAVASAPRVVVATDSLAQHPSTSVGVGRREAQSSRREGDSLHIRAVPI